MKNAIYIIDEALKRKLFTRTSDDSRTQEKRTNLYIYGYDGNQGFQFYDITSETSASRGVSTTFGLENISDLTEISVQEAEEINPRLRESLNKLQRAVNSDPDPFYNPVIHLPPELK